MNTKITLTNPTADELSAAVAERVAGWTYETFPHGACPHVKHWKNEAGETVSIHMDGRFATSADAVLPLLERDGWDWEHRFSTNWAKERKTLESVTIWGPRKDFIARHDYVKGECAFPFAACVALLRANGVEVVFTKSGA